METKPGSTIEFPKGFLWGAATSSHQIEGGNTNNWSEWEKLNALSLAQKFSSWGEGIPAWSFLHPEITDPETYISGQAIDHWNRYREDFQLLKDMNLNSYRLSIEWSRIEPRPGEFDEQALAHYRQMIDYLIGLGIEPFVTLWHWTFPVWISDRGGWENKETIGHFDRFSARVAEALSPVKFWITINEPEIFARESYVTGNWPPNHKSTWTYFKVINNLVVANRQARKAVQSKIPDAKVGIAQNNTYFQPYRNWWFNKLFILPFNWWWNHYFLNRTYRDADFIGLNYYFHRVINLGREVRPPDPKSDLGWELAPYGLFHTLTDLKRYGLDVYVTENGLADARDERREWFIKQSLMSVYDAIQHGVKVKGYLHWSLLDNFEWDKGFWPKFGLYAVDRKTMQRTPRPSSQYYAQIAASNSLRV